MTDRARGRPPVGPVITVRIPPDLLTRLDRAAAEEGTSRSELIRRGATLILHMQDVTSDDEERP